MITQEERNSELYHYGVLGMKWGKHKARSYARDVNRHRYNQAVGKAKRKMKVGDISRAEYIQIKQKHKQQRESENAQINERLSNIKVDRNKTSLDIYGKDKRQATLEISNKSLKRGIRSVSSALAKLSTINFIASFVTLVGATKYYGGATPQVDRALKRVDKALYAVGAVNVQNLLVKTVINKLM